MPQRMASATFSENPSGGPRSLSVSTPANNGVGGQTRVLLQAECQPLYDVHHRLIQAVLSAPGNCHATDRAFRLYGTTERIEFFTSTLNACDG